MGNPLVGALADFRGVLLAVNDDHAEWVRDLFFAACRSKLSARHFVAPQIGPETLPQEHRLLVAKALGRLWSTKSPAWTAAFRDAAAASKPKAGAHAGTHEAAQAAGAEAPESAAPEAPEAAAPKAPEDSAAADAPEAAATKAPEASPTACGYAAAAAAAHASSASTTAAKATPAALKAVLMLALVVGDLVVLDESVGKKHRGQKGAKRVRPAQCLKDEPAPGKKIKPATNKGDAASVAPGVEDEDARLAHELFGLDEGDLM